MEPETIWSGDKLGRQADAEFLETFLINRLEERHKAGINGSYVVNIEAEWGFGKSYFMERFAKQLGRAHPVVFINAWQNDFSDDPYTCVISEVERFFKGIAESKKDVKSELWSKYDALKKNAGKRIRDFEEAKNSLENFRGSLSDLLDVYGKSDEKSLPLFVFIDELDRCRPPYAIAMLERIKHLFDVSNVVFLIATDTKQLAHSINGVYGASFDSHRYLQRFFSRTFSLPKASAREDIEAIIESSGADETKWQAVGIDDDKRWFLAEASDRLGMSLREIHKSMDVLFSITTTWSNAFPMQLSIMYPLIYGYLLGKNIDDLSKDGWLWTSIASISGWHIVDESDRTYWNSGFHQVNSVTDYIIELLKSVPVDMRSYLDRNRRDLRSSEAPPFYTLWAYNIIDFEYNKRFSNIVFHGRLSTINDYGKIIRHAGHLRA